MRMGGPIIGERIVMIYREKANRLIGSSESGVIGERTQASNSQPFDSWLSDRCWQKEWLCEHFSCQYPAWAQTKWAVQAWRPHAEPCPRGRGSARAGSAYGTEADPDIYARPDEPPPHKTRQIPPRDPNQWPSLAAVSVTAQTPRGPAPWAESHPTNPYP